jgi:hypothetical protein
VLLPAGFEFRKRILLALRAHFGKRRSLCGMARACKPIRGVKWPSKGLTTECTENTEGLMPEIDLLRLTDRINFTP